MILPVPWKLAKCLIVATEQRSGPTLETEKARIFDMTKVFARWSFWLSRFPWSGIEDVKINKMMAIFSLAKVPYRTCGSIAFQGPPQALLDVLFTEQVSMAGKGGLRRGVLLGSALE